MHRNTDIKLAKPLKRPQIFFRSIYINKKFLPIERGIESSTTMSYSTTLKRSLLRVGRQPASVCRSLARRSGCSLVDAIEGSQSATESSSSSNGVIRFTMIPKEVSSLARVARGFGTSIPSEATISSEAKCSEDLPSSQLDQASSFHNSCRDYEDNENEWKRETESDLKTCVSEIASDESSETTNTDSYIFDRASPAEQVASMMENSYYYASFKAQ
mmetsp:Transcript_6363/g.13153  ORF Transcript_6363/g.13153 Transcript_6363/m.13153 type:complete len:216 (+) Transcript_6363:858-1505(+)